MHTYKITYRILDNNINYVFIDARGKSKAIDAFMEQYEYDEILNTEEI